MLTDDNYIITTTVFVVQSLSFTQCDDFSPLQANCWHQLTRDCWSVWIFHTSWFSWNTAFCQYLVGLKSYFSKLVVSLFPMIIQRQWPWPPRIKLIWEYSKEWLSRVKIMIQSSGWWPDCLWSLLISFLHTCTSCCLINSNFSVFLVLYLVLAYVLITQTSPSSSNCE